MRIMAKREALVDTCFFQKLTNDGKNLETFKKVLTDLDFVPVVHPYIAQHELDMFPYFNQLVQEGEVRVAKYTEFLKDAEDTALYEWYFLDLYDEMKKYLETMNSLKQLPKLLLPKGQTIFTYRHAGISLGDIHIVLMAFFLKMPVVLSEDNDVKLLKSITTRKMSSEAYSLSIYNVMDLIMMITQKLDTTYSKKELENVVLDVKERKRLSEVKKAWDTVRECSMSK